MSRTKRQRHLSDGTVREGRAFECYLRGGGEGREKKRRRIFKWSSTKLTRTFAEERERKELLHVLRRPGPLSTVIENRPESSFFENRLSADSSTILSLYERTSQSVNGTVKDGNDDDDDDDDEKKRKEREKSRDDDKVSVRQFDRFLSTIVFASVRMDRTVEGRGGEYFRVRRSSLDSHRVDGGIRSSERAIPSTSWKKEQLSRSRKNFPAARARLDLADRPGEITT